jgi:PPE-repeat protein
MPPDITSALVYAGAGSGPLMAAAAGWSNLAAELSTTATQWESIVGTLTDTWTGLGSAGAAASSLPIVSWLTTAAAAAEQAATQATSSAAAYEAAFTGVISPPVIAANRAQLAALVATNFLGINTPAIMATEAEYAEFWVQDAITMYVYQAASAAAAVLQPISPASPSTNPAAAGIQGAATAQAATSTPAQGLGTILNTLSSGPFGGLATAGGNVPSLGQWLALPGLDNSIAQIGVTAAWFQGNMTSVFPSLGHLIATSPGGLTPFVDDVTPLGAGLGMGTSLVSSTNGAGLGGAATAAVGEASSVGGLSVPASWSAATPATLASSTAPLEGSGWTAATEEGGPIAAMPGMPGAGALAKGAGAYAAPRYGVKPIVMPKVVV